MSGTTTWSVCLYTGMSRSVTIPDVAIRLTARRLQMEQVYRLLTMCQTDPNATIDRLMARINSAVVILEEEQTWETA